MAKVYLTCLLILGLMTDLIFSSYIQHPTDQNVVDDIAKFLVAEVNRDNIKEYLRTLTLHPHVGGTPAEWKTAEWVAQKWRSQGLDEVHMTPYEVLLSYPDKENPNYVKLYDESGSIVWKSQGRSPPLKALEESSDEVLPDFNAFSPPGTVKGDIVFVNFGKEKDFDQLASIGVNIKNRIVIAKYGEVFRGNIAQLAEKRGASALLLYSDPQQFASAGLDKVYPDTVFMPGGAAAAGTVYMSSGDPLTPYYPSTENAFRIPEDEAAIPRIPVMPLGYNDAEKILGLMSGPLAPPEWQGGLNITYRVGPGLIKSGWKMEIEVNTHSEKTTVYNVIGVIKGEIEPDRYVVLGNHRDAWIFGSIDPSSGTAAMLELSRTLSEYRNKTGWAPRRSIVFCSWGAEEYGLVGSTEWVEQFNKQLSDRTLAYFNLDMAIEGNYTVRARSAPLLYGISRDIAKLVPNPDENEKTAGHLTVYDTWVTREPDTENPGMPKFRTLGAASDYKGFQHFLGIPCMEYRYTFSKEMYAEPLYHTLYETFYLTSELYDKNFDFHAAIVQLWGISAAVMADSLVIPFSLDEYVTYIHDAQNNLVQVYGELIESRNITTDYFLNATNHFNESVHNFEEMIGKLNSSNPLEVRKVNDQLMMVERAFINPQGLPDRPLYNHIVMAPSAADNYVATAFSTLTDALGNLQKLPEDQRNSQWRTFEEQLAIATHLLETAAKVLSDDLW